MRGSESGSTDTVTWRIPRACARAQGGFCLLSGEKSRVGCQSQHVLRAQGFLGGKEEKGRVGSTGEGNGHPGKGFETGKQPVIRKSRHKEASLSVVRKAEKAVEQRARTGAPSAPAILMGGAMRK